MINKQISTSAMGPRALQNRNQYLQRAMDEKKAEEQVALLKKINEENHLPNLESTATAAQKLARDHITRPSCLDNDFVVHEDSTLCSTAADAVTSFWSQQVVRSKSEGTEQIFARCSGFTNDIMDGRLMHSNAIDSHKDC